MRGVRVTTKETVQEYVDRRLRQDWGGKQHYAAARGYFNVPNVRHGGATDMLIVMAAKIAQDHWNEENEQLD